MRRMLVAALASLAVAAPAARAQAPAAAGAAPVQLMFVQVANGLSADDATIRLVGVSPQTVWFTDRPVRDAGHITMPAFMEEWTAKAGADNFAADPPNATLSVYEPGQTSNSLAVITISHPRVEGNDIVYRYKLISGAVPRSGQATTIFIDWIGVGGGVGPGFHGVGAGARGVGFYRR